MTGVVEEVNDVRAVFYLRSTDGTYAYFRVHRESLPKAGQVISWPDDIAPHGGSLVNETDGAKAIRALSAILHLPREVARSLTQ
jgi:hypothetical protein